MGAPASGEPARGRRPAGAVEDACPGVLRLYEAADGWLARVRVPGGRLDAGALAALADAAVLGNDIVELTSRASLQLRGLAPDAGGELARVLSAAGLLPSLAHDRVRNILAAPLAGRGPAAVAPIDAALQALDRELCADATMAELPGRFVFALDDGTRALDPIRADVELAAERAGFRLRLDGRTTSLAVSAANAPEVALRAAHAFLEARREHAPGAWRLADIDDGARRLAARLGARMLPAASTGAPARSTDARRLGSHLQRDGLFAVSALPPLARLGRGQLARLSALAGAVGAGARISPWRTLTFVDVPCPAVPGLLAELEAIALVTSEQSGWRGLSACAGLGACARARADVRAAAARRAALRGPGSPTEHWSGCERRCGEPADAAIRVVAGEHGLEVEPPGARV